ncbi:MAG: VacJ family lipoprotein [Bdellovibrionales bacterium]|nr:VacJ family lipoprotein [Bdellovibrionales bacterium]
MSLSRHQRFPSFLFQPFSLLLVLVCSLIFVVSSVAAEEEEVSDPLEGINRGIFWFNDKFDRYLLEPVADGYDYITPNFVQDGISNFFSNLRYPSLLLSDLIQLKFDQVATHTGRFLLNSTVGLGGLIDVASDVGLEDHDEDFGTALGYHGVPSGPYLVLPILGPSNVRDGLGRLVDNLIDPLAWVAFSTASNEDAEYITLGATSLKVVNTRAKLDEAIEAARDASVDYYLFTQSAYYQYRDALIHDKASSEEDPFADDEAFDEEMENADVSELSDARSQYAFHQDAQVEVGWYLTDTY